MNKYAFAKNQMKAVLLEILAPIDKTFITRFVFALLFYWVWGILSKGVFEPIQSNLGKNLVKLFNRRLRRLDAMAANTCTKIDNILIRSLLDGGESIEKIIEGCENNLSPEDSELLEELITNKYSFDVLLQKIKIGRDIT